jgi:hypothetical protein
MRVLPDLARLPDRLPPSIHYEGRTGHGQARCPLQKDGAALTDLAQPGDRLESSDSCEGRRGDGQAGCPLEKRRATLPNLAQSGERLYPSDHCEGGAGNGHVGERLAEGLSGLDARRVGELPSVFYWPDYVSREEEATLLRNINSGRNPWTQVGPM